MGHSSASRFGQMLQLVAEEFERGNNMSQALRGAFPGLTDDELSMMINLSYDRQAGDYIDFARRDMNRSRAWGEQVADYVRPLLPSIGGTILEVGVGEATTLAQVLLCLGKEVLHAYGFDMSHSRVLHGNRWLAENQEEAKLFVADISRIPLASNSVDVVYSCHSLEPNRGRERALMAECMRVARFGVVFVEPIYELANKAEQAHMDTHNYVRGLWDIGQTFSSDIVEYKRLGVFAPPNPTGVLALRKHQTELLLARNQNDSWECPTSGTSMKDMYSYFAAEAAGLAYPVLSDVPLLAANHSVVASSLVAGVN